MVLGQVPNQCQPRQQLTRHQGQVHAWSPLKSTETTIRVRVPETDADRTTAALIAEASIPPRPVPPYEETAFVRPSVAKFAVELVQHPHNSFLDCFTHPSLWLSRGIHRSPNVLHYTFFRLFMNTRMLSRNNYRRNARRDTCQVHSPQHPFNLLSRPAWDSFPKRTNHIA